MSPVDNVWVDGSERGLAYAFAGVEKHLRDNANGWAKRALLLPHLSARGEQYLQNYSANKNVGSARGKRPERGGPVLAVDPPLKLLELGLSLADGQLLGVATVHPHEVIGWAAATKALDLATGERHPGVPPEIEEALQDLYDAGYNGYARQRETFFAAKYFPPIDLLMDAGYDVDFVKSYLVALGKAADSVENIDKLYVPKSSRPRTSR
ncbi:hypothetical protein H5U98_06830 [Mycolicibacterium boenickei]|uniref:Uncharacterized protein n=1 Tax=Mycolicibacterium boenickei TaxID=146017 RepID=A0AAX3A0B5_9MYCO|nr:hypothetical protein [Mycolicibacterium boenickei]PEG57654.1 hypothetical protein CQY21_26475 [Mycolicibacterium boenickei]UNC01102.1 hypothetical protein H5U98_06830 [Mycolicibacterium boenickei]BBX90947.1 hypothetical protein MBOE_25960 [Mycolicibacterium boenickei]